VVQEARRGLIAGKLVKDGRGAGRLRAFFNGRGRQHPLKRTRSRRWPLAAIIALAACAAPLETGTADAAGPDPIQITARPLVLDPRDPAADRVGRLVYRGGVSLTANDARFGGWSDVDISDDGARLTAVSDRGYWFDATLEHDERGGVTQLTNGRLGYLLNLGKRRQPGLAGDAEGLSRAPDGSFFVSFERRHRIWLYPASDPPFSATPRLVPPPPGATAMPENGGIEALVRRGGGRLFALSEELKTKNGATVGWVGDGRTWSQVTYEPGADFKPTGAARLPDGDVLVLERRFTRFNVPAARIVRVSGESLRPGAHIVGSELALIEPPLTFDNFEGISVRQGSCGEILIYLISDDNFFFLQRTLLLVFELPPE
jgi:hypothetical protein